VGGPVTPGTSTCSGCSSASSGASSSPIVLAQRSSLRTRASATGDCFERQERERCGDSCQMGSQRGAIVESPCGGSPAMASPCAPLHGTALRPPDPSDSVSADPADGVRPGRPSSATLFRPRGPPLGPLPRPPGLRRSSSYSVPFASAWRARGRTRRARWFSSISSQASDERAPELRAFLATASQSPRSGSSARQTGVRTREPPWASFVQCNGHLPRISNGALICTIGHLVT
jgi:hypothetical protein